MAGTNAVAAKQALIAKIRALEIAGTDGDVQVAYSWPGKRAEREVVHGSNPVTFDQSPLAFRAPGGRVSREEEVTVPICVVVKLPGGAVEDTDVRAAAIGTLIEDAVAADPTLAGTTNLRIARIDGGDIDHGFDDDAAASVLTYNVVLKSVLD